MRKVIIGSTIILLLGISLLLLIRFYPYSYAFISYPKVTSTKANSNSSGDPINVILIGSKDKIMQSFQKAGWLIPDPITFQTSAKIAADSLLHKGYPTAPVSNLYLYGRVQDMAFEKPTNDVQKRNHIRIWDTDKMIDGQEVWIAQTSYDNGIELSGTNHLPTHHISPTVDTARYIVGKELNVTGLVKQEVIDGYTFPIFYAQNGGGDFYESDGNVEIINYTINPISIVSNEGVVFAIKNDIFNLYTQIINIIINI